jgi:carbon storage regulator
VLILSRLIGETLVLDNNITITVTKISGDQVSLGIDAPKHIGIRRGELPLRPESTDLASNVPIK